MEKRDILNMPTIAYFSGYGGIEIKGFLHDENLVLYVQGTFEGKPTAHTSRLRWTEDAMPYFHIYVKRSGRRVYLNSCLRV